MVVRFRALAFHAATAGGVAFGLTIRIEALLRYGKNSVLHRDMSRGTREQASLAVDSVLTRSLYDSDFPLMWWALPLPR
jgi:hypothetical protein